MATPALAPVGGSAPASQSTTTEAPVSSFPPAVNGRDKIHWSKHIWERVDAAVHQEMMRTRVSQKFLPIRPVVPRTTSVPFDSITAPSDPNTRTFSVDEGATTRLIEIFVKFSLTPAQVEHETGDLMELGHSTAVTLATRAANILAQAEDLVIFQGVNAFTQPLFRAAGAGARAAAAGAGAGGGAGAAGGGAGAAVAAAAPAIPPAGNRGFPFDTGLLDLAVVDNTIQSGAAPLTPPVQAVPVQLLNAANPGVYGSNTFAAVSKGIALLAAAGQYGPYALVLDTTPYADTYAPVPGGTLVITADRIRPLVTSGFYVSGTLPTGVPATSLGAGANASYEGLLVSLGGNTMDVVVGLDATTAFEQQTSDGNYSFRVVERFALRLKDTTGVIRLEFQ
jgi:uncharacterized linocin/CFP29 family protein